MESAYSEQVLSRMWTHLGMIYGHKWTSQYGTAPASAWRLGLAELSADEIKRGMELCVTAGDGWPPNLPEFRQMCRDTSATIPACHRPAQPYAALPKLENLTPPDVARPRLAKIRDTLTRGKPWLEDVLADVENVDYAETIARQCEAVWVKPSYAESEKR